ncbi:fumarylacetoacetate hydrolase family protein [Corynebacterium testudinoris]|uniref:2-keto-4-pentenoate hydratase/2-oxohepta-3-ene-1,7-dioic acid hydratase n=1 Tax=Corynebacterium testudinoris TaxID=136857 RepID=A0A0G3H2P1_9CORY|nr:fumarylacetoacetate hydrolase family protein [Corynebacterium testudinoris]AKK07639.1 2-keto-4-pentenoate hydratase/2-oxohepta-3-ene-1,7-dioic acid hydratase [Corynebacterium testudinoris]MBX8996072.1 fumarylacetoacetate hydrolase family protein [Corynebacterium testudinoris]
MTVASQLPVNPGKVIAVHLAFESRAAQRGRRPKQPSYFIKATSSLAPSGAEVVRPEGTELLAFEGEIALVIGEPARNVPLVEAWDHVSHVTASNDLGIYDFRAQDKGSNTRSKSRDGYTPIGPELIDARLVDPAALRLRAWVNGELVQDDGTSDEQLIFPLAQFVADLSQHMTLETGDVILTGTPAGSTVIQPGDVVEVEVDAPTAEGAPTSGRLRTTVVSGPGDFDEGIGMLPAIDDKQREEAWGTRAAAGLAEDPNAISDELRAMLAAIPTAGLSAQLRNRGLNQVVIEGVYPQTRGTKLVGVARTLRFLPGREDLFTSHGGGFNAQKRAFDAVRPGEVLVIEARRETGSGTMGDILALRAKFRGAAGVVTDGGVRDYEEVREVGLPVFSQGPHPAVLGRKHVPWDHDLAIACGNATVVPGDIIVGDDDGVIVIPRHLAEEVAVAALAKEHEDAWVAERVSEGGSLDGLFPPVGENKKAYQAYLADHPVELPQPARKAREA